MITLHRAPWVLPISTPAIADGAVAVNDEQILAVGTYSQLRTEVHDRVMDHEARILMPGLINAHCHLELSSYAVLGQQPAEPGNMPAWISDLLALRASPEQSAPDATLCHRALAGQYADGVSVLVDIGNDLRPAANSCDGIEVRYFTELLGLSRHGTDFGLQTLAAHSSGHHFTCHASYSTSSALLQAVKNRARLAEQLYPIHVAESLDELEFLRTGHGRFRTFLEERGVWDDSFVVPATGAVDYLNQLDLLDSRTLCVHCVHLDENEIELMVSRNAKVCLCPGSNRFLGVGQAPAPKMLAAGLKPCLGTDSVASNPELSLWREMAILAENHPGLSPETIVAMASLYGAEAIGAAREGRLQTGSANHFLAVRYDGDQPFEFLVSDQADKEIVWL